MRAESVNRTSHAINSITTTLTILALFVVWLQPGISHAASQSTGANRRVNVPYLGNGAPYTPAIFWFGNVDTTHNYADVRVDYNADVLAIVIHIMDRRLWADTTPTAAALPNWDAASIYLNLNGNFGGTPDSESYRLEVELSNNFQASYRGNGSAWIAQSIPVSSSTEWRGAAGPNSDMDSEGWLARFYIPYASLGLVTPPPPGTQWGLAVVLHNRDDAQGLTRQDTLWPETMDPNIPSTWGQLSFGPPTFSPPPAVPSGIVTIRQGLNGATVVDGAVGGYTNCGNNGTNKWTAWGSYNYSDPSVNYQFNIQNEWDISDWPCFSKFYVTFPLYGVPAGKTILFASLTMNLRGTAGGGQWGPPPDSYIEVLTIDRDWNASTLTWNNAPLASENIAGTWVHPVIGPYNWDVSRAVAQAYSSGGPLRLALYSIDGAYHTGKYFFSSESTDWNGTVRPTLTVVYGDLCSSPGVTCNFTYLPFLWR
jgi:hypothetical protein